MGPSRPERARQTFLESSGVVGWAGRAAGRFSARGACKHAWRHAWLCRARCVDHSPDKQGRHKHLLMLCACGLKEEQMRVHARCTHAMAIESAPPHLDTHKA